MRSPPAWIPLPLPGAGRWSGRMPCRGSRWTPPCRPSLPCPARATPFPWRKPTRRRPSCSSVSLLMPPCPPTPSPSTFPAPRRRTALFWPATSPPLLPRTGGWESSPMTPLWWKPFARERSIFAVCAARPIHPLPPIPPTRRFPAVPRRTCGTLPLLPFPSRGWRRSTSPLPSWKRKSPLPCCPIRIFA